MRSWAARSACSCWAWFTHSTHCCCHAGWVPELADCCRDRARTARRPARAGRVALAVGVLTALPATTAPAHAEEAPAPAVQCQVTDPGLPELSGLVVGADG